MFTPNTPLLAFERRQNWGLAQKHIKSACVYIWFIVSKRPALHKTTWPSFPLQNNVQLTPKLRPMLLFFISGWICWLFIFVFAYKVSYKRSPASRMENNTFSSLIILYTYLIVHIIMHITSHYLNVFKEGVNQICFFWNMLICLIVF